MIQCCLITDENEFDLFIDDVIASVGELNLSITQRERLNGALILNIENQPESEFTSWSLLHFIEGLDKNNNTSFNKQILESLKSKPKVMTLLLANRIINNLSEWSADRTLFLTALKEVASNNDFDPFVRKQAGKFYEYQINKQMKNKYLISK